MGFWTEVKQNVSNAIREVQKHPVLDAFAQSALESIPVVGGLLVKIYENSKDSPPDKTEQILKILKNYEQMNERDLELEFRKLDENKDEIIKNQDYLKQLVSETSEILEIVKNMNKKLDIATGEITAMNQKVEMMFFEFTDLLKMNWEYGKKQAERGIPLYSVIDFQKAITKAVAQKIQDDYDKIAEEKNELDIRDPDYLTKKQRLEEMTKAVPTKYVISRKHMNMLNDALNAILEGVNKSH